MDSQHNSMGLDQPYNRNRCNENRKVSDPLRGYGLT